MGRIAAIVTGIVGWIILMGGLMLPLAVGLGLTLGEQAGDGLPAFGSSDRSLMTSSLIVAGVASLAGLLLGLGPAMVLGSVSVRRMPVLLGLTLTPLLIPPQIYVYAWGLLFNPQGLLAGLPGSPGPPTSLGEAVRAGLVTAGWLWPVTALIVAAGWRTAGRTAYVLALLDTTPARACVRAVLPALSHHLAASACLIFALGLLEYPIPHLTPARVWASELMVMMDVGVAPSAVVRMAAWPAGIVVLLVVVAGLLTRGTRELHETGGAGDGVRVHIRLAWVVAAAAWIVSVGLPAAAMVMSWKQLTAWGEAFTLFAQQWWQTTGVALAAGLLAVVLTVATVLMWRGSRRIVWLSGVGLVFAAALLPPPALGVAFIRTFNRPHIFGDLYARTPVVWILALTARYAAAAVLVTWLATGRRAGGLADQARGDGADTWALLAHVLVPVYWPSLLAGGLIVALLGLFEVVLAQLVGPVGYPSVGVTLLNHMHYGRDDVVIATSLTVMVGGLLVTMAIGWLLARNRQE